MRSENETLDKLVNASGFMFQLAVERAVEETADQHEFEIEAREHPWRRDGETSFIDLILGRNSVRLICECKRTRDATWVFPVEHDRHDADRTRLRWVEKRRTDRAVAGWHDFHLTTQAPEATFCIVRGQGESDSPMLERIAGRLLLSVEAIASEERNC